MDALAKVPNGVLEVAFVVVADGALQITVLVQRIDLRNEARDLTCTFNASE